MAGIEQLQIQFDSEQDRILLRANDSNENQLRFWLTRRMLKRLLPHLQRILRQSAGNQGHHDTAAQTALFEFQQESVKQNVDFSTEFKEEAESLPLGEDGILVTTVNLKPQGPNLYTLKFSDRNKTSADLSLSPDLLHSLYAVIQEGLKTADWDLPTPNLNKTTPSLH